MWTLHKLNASKRKREEAAEDLLRPEAASPAGPSDQSSPPHAPDGAMCPAETFDAEGLHGNLPYLVSPWEFTQEELRMFPALSLHYDLRMQLDGSTFSWAIPRGLLGISKRGEKNRLAVQTTLHPISYTTYEGGDGRILPSGERCGTLLWDVGSYTIDYPWRNDDSDSENEKRKRRKRGREEQDSDDIGKHEEDKFRMAMQRPVRAGKSRSIHFTLRGGRKMTNHSYILIQSPQNALNRTFSATGRQKVNWFISLPRGVEGYLWDQGGEEGDKYGRSVKTGRTLREVCAAKERIVTFLSEKDQFGLWAGDVFDLNRGGDGIVAGPSKEALKQRQKRG